MSFKDLLVTFVTSEEASITQRSAMSMGAVLTAIVTVSMLIAIAPPAFASCPNDWSNQYCGKSCGSWETYDSCPGSPCVIYHRWCEQKYCHSCWPNEEGCCSNWVEEFCTGCPGMQCQEGCTDCNGNC